MSQDISFLLAFLAGFLSFLSPCVLPIVPVFISYIAGTSFNELKNGNEFNNINLINKICLFILGFSLIFILLGLSVDYISNFLFMYKKNLSILSGTLIILFGLFSIGILNLNFLNRELKFDLAFQKFNLFSPFIIGIAFAFGWSPCIGPILGSVLSIAYQDNVNGALLLTFYSLGLDLPFLLVGFFIEKISNYLFKLNKMIIFFKFFTGILLIITGILILNGSIQSFGFKLNDIIPSFELILYDYKL